MFSVRDHAHGYGLRLRPTATAYDPGDPGRRWVAEIAAEDVREVESAGRIAPRNGEIVRVPDGKPSYIKPGSKYYRRSCNKWIDYKKGEVL